LISASDLNETARTARYISAISAQFGTLEDSRMIYELKRRLITDLVEDAVNYTRAQIDAHQPSCAADIQSAAQPLVRFSPDLWEELKELRKFLFRRVYRHPDIQKMTDGAEEIVGALFSHYLSHVDDLPLNWFKRVEDIDVGERARMIGDFVAGMTDRFAIAEHERLFDATPELR